MNISLYWFVRISCLLYNTTRICLELNLGVVQYCRVKKSESALHYVANKILSDKQKFIQGQYLAFLPGWKRNSMWNKLANETGLKFVETFMSQLQKLISNQHRKEQIWSKRYQKLQTFYKRSGASSELKMSQ